MLPTTVLTGMKSICIDRFDWHVMQRFVLNRKLLHYFSKSNHQRKIWKDHEKNKQHEVRPSNILASALFLDILFQRSQHVLHTLILLNVKQVILQDSL